MVDLFSHSPEPEYVPFAISGGRSKQTIELDLSASDAFDGFTDAVHLWWPVESQSVFGPGSHVAFLRDQVVEEDDNGEELAWADIDQWEAPYRIDLAWTLGGHLNEPLMVEVRFMERSVESCTVTVDYDDGPYGGGEGDFDCDWPLILARFARFMGAAPSLD